MGGEKGKIKVQITNVRNDKRAITTDLAHINMIPRRFYKRFYVNKFEKLGRWEIFPEKYNKRNWFKEKKVKWIVL